MKNTIKKNKRKVKTKRRINKKYLGKGPIFSTLKNATSELKGDVDEKTTTSTSELELIKFSDDVDEKTSIKPGFTLKTDIEPYNKQMIEAIGKYDSYPYYWLLINTYLQEYEKIFGPYNITTFKNTNTIELTDFHNHLNITFKNLLNMQYKTFEKLFINNFTDSRLGIISTPNQNQKTYNEKYLKDLLTNNNLPMEIYEVVKNIMLAFQTAPKINEENRRKKDKIKFLFHGNADDNLPLSTGNITFNKMLPTTKKISEASTFTFGNSCCIYVFCFDNDTNIPFIIENNLLNTVYKNQESILLPPNLKAVPVTKIPDGHGVRPYETTEYNHIITRSIDNKKFIFLKPEL